MKFPLSRCLFYSTILYMNVPVLAQTADNSPKRSDMEALQRWLNDKRMITVNELGGDLSLSGEARVEFQDINQTNNNIQQRGSGGATGKPRYAWDVEVNLMLDYRTDYTWASVKLEFDNDMGTTSGTGDRIRLEKAYLGGRLIAGDTFTWDAEIGRRLLYNVYDSKLEFSSRFDGVMLRFSKAYESIGNFYCNPSVFLINDKINHYGYVAELGCLQIAHCGLGMKYSVIDWYKKFSNPIKDDYYHYAVQQFLMLYQFNPGWTGKRLVKFYGAALNNMIARNLVLPTLPQAATSELNTPPITVPKKGFGRQNWGWYAGIAVGQLKKQGDFAIEVDCQWVQAQAVPEFDANGIGRGNAAENGLYSRKKNAEGGYASVSQAVGSNNYYGFEIDVLYAFTNNLSAEENFRWSRTLNRQIGPDIHCSAFETEFIYAF
jgi:hypothetical protein